MGFREIYKVVVVHHKVRKRNVYLSVIHDRIDRVVLDVADRSVDVDKEDLTYNLIVSNHKDEKMEKDKKVVVRHQREDENEKKVEIYKAGIAIIVEDQIIKEIIQETWAKKHALSRRGNHTLSQHLLF